MSNVTATNITWTVFNVIVLNVTVSNVTVSNVTVSNVTVSNVTKSSNTSLIAEEASIWIILGVYFVCCWVLVTNSIVLMCLVYNRRAVKRFINLQILSLSITDFLEGLSFIPVVMMFQNPVALLTFWSCAVFLYSYLTAQFASILHAFSICIYRLLTLRRQPSNYETNPLGMYKKIFIQVVSLWAGCLVFVLVIFVSFGQYHESDMTTCSLDELLKENYSFSIAILNTMRIIPHIITNVVYIYILIFLSKILRRVTDIHQEPVTATTSKSSSDASNGTIFLTRVNHVENLKKEVSRGVITKHNHLNKNHANGDPYLTKAGSVFIKEQKGAVITIGILLLVLNVFMTPVLVIPFINMQTSDPLGGSMKLIMALFPLLNSMINPLVYFFRIKSFKTILQQLFVKICAKLPCKT